MARITPEIAAAYALVEQDVFDSPALPLELGEGEEVCRLPVRRSDIDTNHHVNNLVYLDYAWEALPEDLWKTGVAEISVTYRRQFLLGDTVECMPLPPSGSAARGGSLWQRGAPCHGHLPIRGVI